MAFNSVTITGYRTFQSAESAASKSIETTSSLIDLANNQLDQSQLSSQRGDTSGASIYYTSAISNTEKAKSSNIVSAGAVESMIQDAETLNQQQTADRYLARFELNSQNLNSLESRISNTPNGVVVAGSPTASAGNLVNDDARATVSDSRTQNPAPGPLLLNADGRIESPPDTDSSSNAVDSEPSTFLENVDSGLNAPVRTIEQTQSTSLGDNEQGGPLLLNAELDGREEFDGSPSISTSVGGLPGAGAPRDDTTSKNATKVEIDNVFNEEKIVPQPNVLDQYASYTYSASLYLMNKTDYQAMMKTKIKQLRGAQLLMQSGGAPVGGRNQFFTNDYYIEKIELRSAITGKGTNAAHNVNTVKMTVVEPNGITLINNLDRAVQAYIGTAQGKKTNFAAQMYLLVIRFYGYDAQGNLVKAGTVAPDGISDRSAFVEKWYPLCISKIDFKVANKLVEYEIEAASPSYQVNAGTSRGSIPYNVELSGVTVKDVLSGPAQYTTVTSAGIQNDDEGVPLLNADQGLGGPTISNSAPANASAAPSNKTTIRQGLFAAINEYQAQLVRQGIYTYPDTYSVEFVNASLEQALIKNKGSTDKSKVSNSTSKNAADQKLGAKQSADNNSKIATITAGSQIVQVIDQVVRNSSYLEDQAIVIFDPNSQKEKPNGAAAKNLAYFKIGLEATPTNYDPLRNDYAYDIKYTVNIYRINESGSNYFYIPTFKGSHKQYNYWFTGENTSVLSYEQTYNSLYTSVLSGGSSNPATIINDRIKFNFSPGSGESRQGADGKVNETKANLADYLFNPGDLANCTMTIVGDPAWLQQGEAFAGLKKNDPFYFRSFLADGTINFDSQQICFEILINSPRDYNLSTGLIDPNEQTTYFLNGRQPGAARQSYVYRANECISEFNKGKFTQTLKGTLNTYYPDQTFKANQAITAGIQQDTINSLIQQARTGSFGSLVGALSTPGFFNNLSGTGLTNLAVNAGLNLVSGTVNNILGSAPTRPATPSTDPTSSGIPVGTPGILVVPESQINQAVDLGPAPPQSMAAGDDAGAETNGPELLNREA